jgi:hypothetical protein
MKIGLWIIVASMLVVVLEGFAAFHLSGNFWPSQVMARWGKAGISFFTHGGMWGDMFLLPALMAVIVVNYADEWTSRQIVTMAAIGIAITLGNHVLLIFTQVIPDPLGWKEEKWSTLIALHFVYMSTYVALVGLFFFCSPNVSVTAAVTVAVILGIHMAFGTHIPLGVLQRWTRWMWCPEFLHSQALWMQLGIWIVLTALATIASGWRAGLSVAVIGTILAGVVTAILRFGPPPLNT